MTPVPLRLTRVGELDALLVTVMLPLALPAVAGRKAAVNGVDCPAARVMGKLSPLRLKPAPLAVAAVIVTLDEPVFVNVTVCWLVFPT